ncbi:tripartite ATP-independent transporter DctP family solute receptor [Natranaerovirga hydrolytica]|uniref:Tripartite ATP-independent transporter DctP family solute receptor n=1 Tax=Natranaerovirga hydrolytica TaxID=680378 RepID=A0A4R1MN46_9FIRM|nr:TRAP transporter substrate-binding protein [Natranaerovirga hydrolytica]TCK92714.1 tripartite ATP-independent transporter DctP family solute receptor [Natranaerovirga hydrolytica]
MKKTISILVISMLVMSLIGCTSEPSQQSSGENAVTTTNEVELELIVAHNQTSQENPYAHGMNKFKEEIEKISDGKVNVTVHHGTLGQSESELIENMQMGSISMVVASPGFMTAIGVPEIDIFSLLYLFDSFDHWEKAVDGDFGDTMKETVKEQTNNSFKIMDYWTASVRDYYGKEAIQSPDDIAGMTIRTQTSGVVREFWEEAGAIPTSVAWGELYQALSQGVVDSAENDYTNFMLQDHHRTANGKYVSETNHDYTTRLLLMDGNVYDSLTEEQQGWIDEAVKAATEVERQVTYDMYAESKQKVIEDGGIITEYEDMDIEAFTEIAIPIQDRFAEQYNMQSELDMIRSVR